jgi:hypothetical protein
MVVDIMDGIAGKIIFKLVQKSAEEAHRSALVHEEVNQQKKPIDEEVTKNLSLLVRIGHKIFILLKCIVSLVCSAI